MALGGLFCLGTTGRYGKHMKHACIYDVCIYCSIFWHWTDRASHGWIVQSPSFWGPFRGLHGWCGSRTCCSLVMRLGLDFWLNFSPAKKWGYLNQVNIEYVKKDTYHHLPMLVESNQANLYWCKWNFASVSRRSVWPSPWHNIVHIQLQYICILIYPHLMDQSFVFRSLCNLDFHTLSRPVTWMFCTP